MRTTTQSLIADLAVAVDFFQSDPVAQQLPFLWGFPRNSCESVSTLFGAALARKYGDSTVMRVHGRTSSDSQHFWVEVDSQVVDATANQFPSYAVPFVSQSPSPLENDLPNIERLPISEALKNLELSFLRIDAASRDAMIGRLFEHLEAAT